jgi:hypothetical protein
VKERKTKEQGACLARKEAGQVAWPTLTCSDSGLVRLHWDNSG